MYLVVLCALLALSAFGHEPPIHQVLGSFDKRRGAPAAAETVAAAGRLKERIPSAKVDFDELTGSPRNIIARTGFLHRGHAESFVRENRELFGHGPEAIAAARIQRDSTGRHNGVRTVVWQQHLDNIRVFEGVFIAHTSAEGDLAAVSSKFVPDVEIAADRGMPNWRARKDKLPISREIALAIAARNLEAQDGNASGNLVWLPISSSAMKLAWEVHAKGPGGDMYRLLIDAESGEVVMRHLRTFYLSEATYNVFTGASPAPLAPAHATPLTNQAPIVPRTRVTVAALSTNASPIGWISDAESETRGNNVDAHLDRNADDQPDLPRPNGGPDRVFDFPLDPSLSPQMYGDAATVNLFYWCNWMHDRLYELGFDEAAGNFQKDNFGRGGLDNDAMIADGQDGSGVNNARYFPFFDGTSGRIEMFTFNGPDPDRDGDLDSEIILHEYTHGLTDRMVGGGVGIYQLVTIGLAEGWSDFYALALLNDGSNLDANYTEGAYATYQLAGLAQNYYYGIRRYPYTTDMTKNPLTFKDIDPSQISAHPNVPRSPLHPFHPAEAEEPHRMGELWCVTLWEARANLIRKHGFPAGNELTLQLVTDGLKLSPPNPTFLQGRDAILLADRLLTGGANQGELWAAFAKRGMGTGAVDAPNWTTEGIRESFDRPDSLALIPTGTLRFSGPSFGPITPTCRSLVITGAVSWSASSAEPYFALSSSTSSILEVCPGAGAHGLPAGTYTVPLYITNLTTAAVHRRDLVLQILAPATMPFSENFETPALRPFWTVTGAGLARTLLSTNNEPRGGRQHLTLSSGAEGWYARNEATLAIDLEGYTNVVLRFWAKEFNDGPDGPPISPFLDSADFDGVAISTDGHRWFEAAGLRRLRQDYSEVTVNLDDALAQRGLAYNAQFRIRFNQAGTWPIPEDGIAIDDITISGIAPQRFAVGLPGIVAEGDGTLSSGGTVTLPVAPTRDVLVQLTSSIPEVVAVPATVLLPAGATSVAFDLTVGDDEVLDGEQLVVIAASAFGYHTGEQQLRVSDNEGAVLSLGVQGELREGRGVMTGAGRVQLDRAPTTNLLVQLTSSDPDILSVPPGVFIHAGETSAVFNLHLGDDGVLDGPQEVTLSAKLTDGIQAALTLPVLDNETTNLFVSIPPLLNEGSTTLTSAGTARISGTVSTNVTVFLASSDTNRVRVPASVTIQAGRVSANFSVTLVDEAVADGTRVVSVSATASGFGAGSANMRLLDNDSAPFAFNPRPKPATKTSARGVQLAWDLGTPELVVNGDFETGNFAGWVKETSGGGEFLMNSGAIDPPGPEGRTPPYAGTHSALSQQNSPGQRTLYQSVTLPVFFDSAVLNWTHRIRNHAGLFSGSHFFRVEVRGADDSLLAVAFATQPGDAPLRDWEEHSFSLQPYRGQTIRIVFIESDSLGFLNVGLDNVRIYLNSPGTVTSEVYVGPHTNLGPAHFQGAITGTVWQLPPLALDAAYYWQIITRRGDARTVNPVWQFGTRGIGPLDHFAWNPVASNQVMGRPFPASIIARDADGNTISNFSRSVSLTGQMPDAAEPVQVLTFTGFRATQREYRRTLAAISIHFTNYVETFFTATDPSVLEAQLAGKKVFLVVEQDGAPADRMAPLGSEWAPVLKEFVSNGGIVIVCSYVRDEHEILNSSELMQLTKLEPMPSAELRVIRPDALSEGVSQTFSAPNLSAYTSSNGTAIVTISNTTAAVVLARDYGAGRVVMIGTDYQFNRTAMDRVAANAVKLAQGPTSREAIVAPAFTGYFVNGMWAGNVAVLAAGSNIVLTANDGQGHVGRSIPLAVAGYNDLAVTLADAPDPVTLGSNMVYRAEVRNSGPATATGVELTIGIPPQTDIVNVSNSAGSCVIEDSVLRCRLGALSSNATAQVTLEASARNAGTIEMTAEVTADAEDPYLDNNRDTVSTSVGFPSIFISFKSAPEGHTGSNILAVPLQLRPPSSKTVTVRYASSNMTATAGVDYLSGSGVVTFAPGQTNQTVSFTVLGDRLHEGTSERFAVYLSQPTNAILGEIVATASIQDDDPAPSLSILDTSLVEGADGTTTQAVFAVQLSTNAGVTVSANYSTAGGSARPVLDFLAAAGTIRLPPGITNTNVVVTVKGDRISEANEAFQVKLSDAANATFARSQATATIVDDDIGELARFAWDHIPTEQRYGVPFEVTVTAKDALGNTATNFSGPVSLAGWASPQQRTVGPGGLPREFPMGAYFHDQRLQAIYPPSEVGEASRITALALLVQTPPGQTLDRWTIRMKHSDWTQFDQPVWEQDWTTVYDNNETLIEGGWVTFQFSEPFEYNGVQSLLVDFSFNNATYSVDGQCDTTPTAGLRAQYFRTDSAYGDPLGWSGSEPPAELARWVPSAQFFGERRIQISPQDTGTFADGVWSGEVAVFDVVEEMSLRADDGANHSGSANVFRVVTTNDLAITATDAPDPARAGDTLIFTYQITNSGPAAATGIILSNLMPAATTATFVGTSQGSCVLTAGVVTCALGRLEGGATASVTVHAIPEEGGFLTNSVVVSSDAPELFRGNNRAATVTRVNDRALFVSDVSVTERSGEFTNAVFLVRLSSVSSNQVSVEYFTSDLTASNGLDYVETRGLLVFAPGVTNLTVAVPVIGDLNDEASEAFRFNFGAATNAAPLSSVAVATILDDDLPPFVTVGDASMVEGNAGAAFFTFPVEITPASGLFARVTFSTSNGTARAGSDYFQQTLTTIIPPGFTNRVISTTIYGDREVEPDETFFLRLSAPQNMTLATNLARGTIVNDDGLAGVVETFAWSHVPSPQRVGQPVAVAVEARDSYGSVVTNFDGTALIRGRAGEADVTVGGNSQSMNPFTTSFHDNRVGAIYLKDELAGARRIAGLALEVLIPPGQPLNRWTIRMKHTTLSNYVSNIAWDTNGWTTVYENNELVERTGWVPFMFQTPFDYDGTNNLLVDWSFDNSYFTVDGQCRFTLTNQLRSIYAISDSEFGDPRDWTGVPGPIVLSGIPTVRFICGSSVAVTPDITAAFDRGVWTGSISALEPAAHMRFIADDTAGHIGLSAPFTTEYVPDADSDGLLDEWELAYFGSLAASANADADGDGLTNLEEQTAGTHPLDSASVLRVVNVEFNGLDVNVRFTSVAGRTYRVERSTGLHGDWTAVADNLPGIDGVLQVTDFSGAAENPRFYRVVLLP